MQGLGRDRRNADFSTMKKPHACGNLSGKAAGFLATVLLHTAAGYALFAHRPVAPAVVLPAPIMVRFVAPPEPPKPLPVTRPRLEPVTPPAVVPPKRKPKPANKRAPPRAQPRARPAATPEPVPARETPAPRLAAAPQPASDETVAAPAEVPSPAPEPPARVATVPAAPPAPPSPPPVTPPAFNADYLQNPPPRYPPLARRMGQQGKVLLRVLVSAGGTAARVEVRQTSGSAMLDAAALDAVKGWRFVPARQGSEPVAAWVIVPVIFTLQG